MGFLYGFVGAFSGAITGIVAASLAVAAQSDGNDFGDGFTFLGYAPIGLIVGIALGTGLALKLRRYAQEHWGGKEITRKTTLAVVGSLLAVPALVTVMLWSEKQLRKPPSDQQLLANFNHHRGTFDQLARMTQADKHLARVDYNWTNPTDPRIIGVSPTRIGVYRRLLDSVHVHRGFYSYNGHRVEYMCWGHGSAISSDEDKGYAYLTVPPEQVLTSLNDCQPDERNGVKAYRHIEDCWYLYYDYLPG